GRYGDVLRLLGRMKEAEPMFKEVVERRRKVLGEDHADTIASLNYYANMLTSLGRAGEAEPMLTDALSRAALSPSLGPQHPVTLTYVKSLIQCLEARYAAGEREAALA